MTARWLLALCCTMSLAGCGTASEKRGFEYVRDMTYSLAYDSFAPNTVTRDGLTLQRPVRGTIARGHLPLHYGATPQEAERAGRELQSPIAATTRSAAEGHALFDIYCVVCHGATGAGDGPLIPKIPNPPAYTSERVRSMPAGRIFHVVTYGSGRMPSYASQLSVTDRWLVVAHVQTLQHQEDAR
ncbi:MAG TPA: c-type cytochrome [Vicinamibacterales bacterium]|nr:c-type cytochrome [Vicinamibacterales bacterium]